MDFLNGLKNFLQMINDNWTTIIVIIGLIIAITEKIKSFIAKTKEEKIKIAKSQIKEILLTLVTSAETAYDDLNKSGEIKRSAVISRIFAQYPILAKISNQEDIMKWLDVEIDIALDKLNNIDSKH